MSVAGVARARRRAGKAGTSSRAGAERAALTGILDRLRLRRVVLPAEPELPGVARNVAIIMDGNVRWARRRRLPVLAGHRAGTRALRRTVEASIDLGVR